MTQGMKHIIGVVAGLTSGVITIFIFQLVSSMIYKMPEGLDTSNSEAMAAWMQTLPPGAYLLVLAGYASGAFDGALVATLVSGRASMRPAMIIGVTLTAANAANLVFLPQPAWFAVTSCLIFLPFAWLGYRLLRVSPTS